jgi:hypothetical protein
VHAGGPDGKSVYVSSLADGEAIFARDKSTEAV